MRTTRMLLHVTWVVCCGCVANEQRMDAASTDSPASSASDEDSSAPRSDDKDAAESAPTDDRDAESTPTRDAGAMFDAGSTHDAGDACARDVCSAPSTGCDDDHACGADDSVCVEHVCQRDPNAPASASQRSAFSARVGLVGEDDTTLFCTPIVTAGSASSPASVASELQRIALDGTKDGAPSASAPAQRIRFQCFADASMSGATSVVTSSWSRHEERDRVSAHCPTARPYAAFAQCQLASSAKPPFVYAGPTCGDGLASVSEKPSVRGQLIGDHYELSTPDKPLFNNTGKAGVIGTDLGYQFLAQGRMYVGFGDTWENELSVPGVNGYRGSILTYTHDFDPSDANGIAFEGWETDADHPDFAREVVASPHDQSGNTEFTAIATSGFGLSEAGAHYRVLWFAAIKTWNPYRNNEATLAWSKDGGAFTRGDKASDVHPPRWPFETHFGPAAIWVDREHGYVYFIGVRTYSAGFPLRLARVRATLSAVLDHAQYEYWTGSGFQHPDPKDEYALARLADPAADLVPGSSMQNNRPEISVAYNPYLGRFTLLLQNDATPFQDEPQTFFELWQAEAITGPWQRANTGDALTLPPHHYGPYMSEQTFAQGGRELYFTLSEWDLSLPVFGQPYSVGLWSMRLERRIKAGCQF